MPSHQRLVLRHERECVFGPDADEDEVEYACEADGLCQEALFQADSRRMGMMLHR